MRLKLTLTGADTPSGTIDLEVDAPADMTVGELAADLSARSAHHAELAATLARSRNGVSGAPIDPNLTLDAAEIVSGLTLDFVGPGVTIVPTDDIAPVAVADCAASTGDAW